jgi:hypothetical protein
MLAAVIARPSLTTDGSVMPTAPPQPCSVSTAPTVSATASGVAGCGVGRRTRGASTSPVPMSTTLPLTPVPPMSTPNRRSSVTGAA